MRAVKALDVTPISVSTTPMVITYWWHSYATRSILRMLAESPWLRPAVLGIETKTGLAVLRCLKVEPVKLPLLEADMNEAMILADRHITQNRRAHAVDLPDETDYHWYTDIVQAIDHVRERGYNRIALVTDAGVARLELIRLDPPGDLG